MQSGLNSHFTKLLQFFSLSLRRCYIHWTFVAQDDIENFKVSVLKAMDAVRPVKCGILPLPTLGVHRPAKEKLKREIKLPHWMYRQLEQNQVPGVYGGQSLGHAAMLAFAKREKLAFNLSPYVSKLWQGCGGWCGWPLLHTCRRTIW